MNPLEAMPALRARVYTAFWAISLALGGTQVGYAAAELGQPAWLAVAMQVYTFLAVAVGYTAYKNTNASEAKHAAPE